MNWKKSWQSKGKGAGLGGQGGLPQSQRGPFPSGALTNYLRRNLLRSVSLWRAAGIRKRAGIRSA
jgi:hypothetical protein